MSSQVAHFCVFQVFFVLQKLNIYSYSLTIVSKLLSILISIVKDLYFLAVTHKCWFLTNLFPIEFQMLFLRRNPWLFFKKFSYWLRYPTSFRFSSGFWTLSLVGGNLGYRDPKVRYLRNSRSTNQITILKSVWEHNFCKSDG